MYHPTDAEDAALMDSMPVNTVHVINYCGRYSRPTPLTDVLYVTISAEQTELKHCPTRHGPHWTLEAHVCLLSPHLDTNFRDGIEPSLYGFGSVRVLVKFINVRF